MTKITEISLPFAYETRSFRQDTLEAYPSFSYEQVKAHKPKQYANLRTVEAEMDNAVGKPIEFLDDLNRRWWEIFGQALADDFFRQLYLQIQFNDLGRCSKCGDPVPYKGLKH